VADTGSTVTRPVVSARDRRARIAASTAFAVQGLCFAVVIARVPVLQDKFALSDSQLTLVLGAVPVVAGVGSVLAGVFAPRWGSSVVLRIGNVGVAAAVAAAGLVGSMPLLYATVAGLGLFLGVVDASMNMQGVSIQRRYGRSILASCHAWWSIAAIVGAAAAIAAAKAPLSGFLGTVAVLATLLALSAGPRLLRRGEESSEGGRAESEDMPAAVAARDAGAATVRAGRIVLMVGVALMVMFIGDAATTSWGGIFLQNVLNLDANDRFVPAGLFAYLSFQFLGRNVADTIIGRSGAVATLVGGGLVGAAGFAVAASAPNPWLALAGFALIGAGLSVVVPLTFSAADALDPAGTGTVIAKVNLFNYAGVIIGTVLIGIIGDASNYRVAFIAPAVLVLAILALSPAFRVVDAARGRSARAVATR
jgi:MFS family permease